MDEQSPVPKKAKPAESPRGEGKREVIGVDKAKLNTISLRGSRTSWLTRASNACLKRAIMTLICSKEVHGRKEQRF